VNSIEVSLRTIAADLDACGRSWALVGALAVAAHAEARSTLDVDVAVAVTGPDEAKATVSWLLARNYRLCGSFDSAMTSLEVPAAPLAGLRLDLLFALAGIEVEVATGAERTIVVPGLELPVARLGDLIALKLLAAREPEREHDRRDLRALVNRASSKDLSRARWSIDLLIARSMVPTGELERALEQLMNRRPDAEYRE